ncbi:aminotransferase class V-fold PLP-dependent enzyme [Mesorhizobium sp. WSM2561]|uniref:aminotransferase class V-fold PLP-dependent enzyme n=1 Tax=Mesorhizobium sp. WSM2561 TaxID=1040985 RepID=UPI0004B01999|nr:aminotransferase class V-fold PLP-dependent enzyme [Mesorhizobium sp. WSM2561]
MRPLPVSPYTSILAPPELRSAGWIYRSFGVEPVINCAGVRTNYGGSNPADDVIDAMNAAADAFVDLDELAEAVGSRLAALTGAEWGIVTSGSAGGLALATAACLAGNDPERMLQLPDAEGLPNRVLLISDQRIPYDQAVRIAGGKPLIVSTLDHAKQAIGTGQVALIVVLGRKARGGTAIPLASLVALASQAQVPIFVDAAGLRPGNPDPWLSSGADLVVYSAGKYLRGPQSTGLLLGNKALCSAAWFNGPPHQGACRALKVGKEEIVGAVTALERWFKEGSEEREREAWRQRLDRMLDSIGNIPFLSATFLLPSDSVTALRVRLAWDANRLGINSQTLIEALLSRKPRILIHDFWATNNTIVVDPFNLTEEEAAIVGEVIRSELLSPRSAPNLSQTPPHYERTGSWLLTIKYPRHLSEQSLELVQDGHTVYATHRTERSVGHATGQMVGDTIMLQARHEATPMAIYYTFEGKLLSRDGEGIVRLGAASEENDGPVFRRQFGTATWTARRAETTTVSKLELSKIREAMAANTALQIGAPIR